MVLEKKRQQLCGVSEDIHLQSSVTKYVSGEGSRLWAYIIILEIQLYYVKFGKQAYVVLRAVLGPVSIYKVMSSHYCQYNLSLLLLTRGISTIST